MTAIADSNAYLNRERLLAQHQAALTLLQAQLSNPAITSVHWLDLACGRGQVLATLEKNLSEKARGKVHYFGYDVDQTYLRETERHALSLGLASVTAKIGDLQDFGLIVDEKRSFDFITLTNTVHEVRPVALASLLLESLSRLSETGCLFIYDMESIHPPELGAVPWTSAEFEAIISGLLDHLEIPNYLPEVGHWKHSSCEGWNVQVYRSHLGIDSDQLRSRLAASADATHEIILSLLSQKLAACRAALESLTRFGPRTKEEEDLKVQLLYTYWSLSRAGGLHLRHALFFSHLHNADPELLDLVVEAANQAGFEVLRPREFAVGGSDYSAAVQTMIHSSSALIALIDRPSLNIAFEIGFALGAGKDVLIIATPDSKIPSDLAGIRYFRVSGDTSRNTIPLSQTIGELELLSRPSLPARLSFRDELLACTTSHDFLASIDPQRFELLVRRFLESLGFESRSSKDERDMGYDFIVQEPNKGGLLLVEAKKYAFQTKVSTQHVYELLRQAQLLRVNSALLIAPSGFTPSAVALAERSSPKLTLLSLEQLLSLGKSKELLTVVAGASNPSPQPTLPERASDGAADSRFVSLEDGHGKKSRPIEQE